ncbi:DUF5011 domain-containing protein [Candidatus Xianfuyuplasma coldseepsis]|uniref:DUF5011 domain-containing protein n=1 Tax=Candidatus Xianfuyuplasma coldseepsis TaxID=2782163 RepID=A0A7L7KQI2_9MOLU|nr:DUF5011 domain-containing protein [Xianfuyuplasma coldseepsis]QMS84542.1 DUF5011 domain-containing protein [Xianfuyuplasma coldseepsis]
MKKVLLLMVTVLFSIGLAGCDLFGGGGDTDTVPGLTLVGDATIELAVGDTYTELGALAIDVEDGDISDDIVIDSSAVNTNQAGTYTVTYNVTDSDGNAAAQVTREVVVTAVNANQAPTITLTGDATIYLEIGDTYIEYGATATDPEDGTLTVVIDASAVNTQAEGTYVVTYNVQDNDGLAATQVTRAVVVTAVGADLPPTIALVGDAAITLVFGAAYNEPGVTATDAEDGTAIIDSLVVDGSVNSYEAGTYVLTYTVTDSNGSQAQVTRTVTVLPNTNVDMAQFIVDNWDGSMQFLGLVVQNMALEDGMKMQMEVDFEVTEDIDEVHYVNALMSDTFVFDELNGDTIQRQITLDIDGEVQTSFTIIFKEVETGVHIYVEYRPLLETIAMELPEATEIAGWVGLDDQWMLFKADDSLSNVVEFAVVKDMLVSMLFSEVGELFFYQIQEDELEPMIGFDLNQYGVDIGQFIDFLIADQYEDARILLENIDVEGIITNADYLYVSPMIHQFLSQYDADLTTAGFDTTKLDMLLTSHFDEVSEEFVYDAPFDGMHGTQAFFESLTETELDTLVEVAIKPFIEQMIYQMINDEWNPSWLEQDFRSILEGNQEFLAENWPEASDPFIIADELILLDDIGAVNYWYQLSWDEQGVIYWALDMNRHGWSVWDLEDMWHNQDWYRDMLVRYSENYDYYALEQAITDMIVNSETYLWDTYFINAYSWTDAIQYESRNFLLWYHNLPWEEQEAFQAIANLPDSDPWRWAFDQMNHMLQDPWQYSWYFTDGGMVVHEQWITDTFIELLNNHSTYLWDEYGLDTTQLIDEINMMGGIEWYLWYIDGYTMEALHEIASFPESDPWRWAVDNMEEVYDREWDFWWEFGRPTERWEIEGLQYEMIQLLWYRETELWDNYSIDAGVWVNNIENAGLFEWWNSLTETDKQNLDAASMMSEPYEWRWAFETLMMWDQNPDQYGWCYGHWDHCVEEQWLNEDLVALIQSNEQWLTDEFGFDVPTVLNDINMYGARQWYFNANDNVRDALREVAESGDWAYDVLWKIEDLYWSVMNVEDFLTTHQVALDGLGFDTAAKISSLQMNGLQYFVEYDLSPADIEILADYYVYPKLEGLIDAINVGEVPEFILDTIFADPHVEAWLQYIIVNGYEDQVPFDPALIAQSWMAIDFDALLVELETFDFEALGLAIYDGEVAFNIYAQGLGTTAPNMGLFLEVFGPGVGMLEEYMVIVDDIQYAYDNLSLFEPYFSLDYWMNQSNMDVTMAVTPEDYVEMEMTMGTVMYITVVEDIMATINQYMQGFQVVPFPYDTNWACVDPMDYECQDIDQADINALLAQLGDMSMFFRMDPLDPSWIQAEMDMADFMDVIVQQGNAWMDDDPYYTPHPDNNIITGVNVANVTVTIFEDGTITLPATEDTDVLNDLAEDFGKFAVGMFARDIMREVEWIFERDPNALDDFLLQTEYTLRDLQDFYGVPMSDAFDKDLSVVTYTYTAGVDVIPQLSITLYWVDGTEALNGPISLADMNALFDEYGDFLGGAAYQTMVGFVNDTNFHLTKTIMMFLMQENRHEDEYKDGGMYEYN